MNTPSRLAFVVTCLGLACSTSHAVIVIDPDAFAAGTILNNAFPNVTLRAFGDAGVLSNSNVLSATDANATTGSRVFADTSGSPNYWGDGAFSYLRADFALGASQVWLDFAANDVSDSNPFLRAYNSSNVLVGSATAGLVSFGSPITLSVAAPDIAYITASWDEINRFDNGALDNLRYEERAQSVPDGMSTSGAIAVTLLGILLFGRRQGRAIAG